MSKSYTDEGSKCKDIKIPLNRNGKKSKFLMNFIQSVYYESHRQTASAKNEKISVKELPMFVDCFGGTAIVSASMNVESSKKVVNEFDPVVSTSLMMIQKYPDEFIEKYKDFNLKALKGYYTHILGDLPNGFCKKKDRDFDFYTLANYIILLKGQGNDDSVSELDLLKNIRNAWFYAEYILSDSNAEHIRDMCKIAFEVDDFTDEVIHDFSDEEFEDLLEIACCFVYYQSAAADLQSVGNPTFRAIDYKQHYKMLSNYFKLPAQKEVKSFSQYLLGVQDFEIKKDFWKAWRAGLEGAIFGRLSFEEVLPSELKKYWDSSQNNLGFEDRLFYYFDSPYWLTSQYSVGFTDEMHKIMLDSIRGSDVNWLFSMQYKPPSLHRSDKDQSMRTNEVLGHINKIKDYYTYYTGFIADLVLENKSYISSYESSKDYKDVYVILIDRNVKGVGRTATTKEIFVTNVDCKEITPNGGLYVQLPMKKFLDFIEKYRDIDVHAKGVKKTAIVNSQYDEIVAFAKNMN